MITNSKIKELLIKPSDSLFTALKVIDDSGDGATKLALIVDDDNKLVGTLTDGDIRRALLNNTSLDETVSKSMVKDFFYVQQGTSRARVLDQMRALCIDQIPVLDENGVIIALHLLREMIEAVPLPYAAVIMAGGMGTRLRPITENLPKPMVRVAGRPILEHIIYHLVGHGIKKIFLTVNYMAEVIENYFRDGAQFGCSIEYLREDKPLGTAGSLSLLPEMKNDLILMNGDLISQFDVKNIIENHQKKHHAITIGARDHVTDIAYGVLKVDDKTQEVSAIIEKPALHHLVNGGVYALSPDVLSVIPKNTMYLATDLIDDCIKKNMKVGYHLLEKDWVDIGEHQQLASARGD